MRLSLVAAVDRNFAIGKGNALPWHLPADLKRFKALTLGKPLLMGRRTAESLGRALPGRRNLVLTRGGRVPFLGMEAVASRRRGSGQTTMGRTAMTGFTLRSGFGAVKQGYQTLTAQLDPRSR